MMNSLKKQDGRTVRTFTVVELLVVIVILGILFAIALPKLIRGKEYARQVVCMQNQRQIATAYQSYMHDNDQNMPLIERWLDDFTPTYQYTKSLGIYKCPSSITPELTSVDQLVGGTDYLTGGNPTDIERNMKYNNGHGNSPYHFDISNPSPKTQAVIAAKTAGRVVYEYGWENHFGGLSLNVTSYDDSHYFKETEGLVKYWTLDDRGWIDTSLDPFPPYMNNGTTNNNGASGVNGSGDTGDTADDKDKKDKDK